MKSEVCDATSKSNLILRCTRIQNLRPWPSNFPHDPNKLEAIITWFHHSSLEGWICLVTSRTFWFWWSMCPHVWMGHEWLAMARVSQPVTPTSQFLIALAISNLVDMSCYHWTRVWRVKTIAKIPLWNREHCVWYCTSVILLLVVARLLVYLLHQSTQLGR